MKPSMVTSKWRINGNGGSRNGMAKESVMSAKWRRKHLKHANIRKCQWYLINGVNVEYVEAMKAIMAAYQSRRKRRK